MWRRGSSVTRRGGSGSGWSTSMGPRSRSDGRRLCAGAPAGAGWPVGEAFVPQVHEPGAEAEVDWGEAWVDAGAGRARRCISSSCARRHSGAAFAAALLGETQQAFLEAHVEAFEFFGGVFGAGPLRQPDLGGEAGAEGPSAGGERPLRRDALALPVRVGVHVAGVARGRTRRAVSRARSAASAAAISSRCPSVASLAELNAMPARRLRGRPARGGSSGARHGRRGAGAASGRCCARCPPSPFDARSRPRRGSTPRRW